MNKIKEYKSVLSPDRRKPIVILEDKKEIKRGRLKFFNDEQSYGFVTLDDTAEDVFVYLDELYKAGLSGADFKVVQYGRKLPVSFLVVSYIGKVGKSKKAVDLKVLPDHPDTNQPTTPEQS